MAHRRLRLIWARGSRPDIRTIARLAMASPLFVAAVVIGLAIPSRGFTPAPLQFNQGLQGGWAVDDHGNGGEFPHSLVTQYPQIRDAGAGWVRLNFRLGHCFKDWTTPGCTGKTALETYDPVVNAARDTYGLRILGLLSSESWKGDQGDWTMGAAERTPGNGDNPYIRAFSDYAAAVLAGHFSGRVEAWEIWNEPNAFATSGPGADFQGATYLYPSNFAWLLTRSHRAIKHADPGAPVISGGLLSHDGGGSESGADYLHATYSSGIWVAGWGPGRYPMDGIGQHLYVDQFRPTTILRLRDLLDTVRDAYRSFEGHGTGKETYVTEFGWPSSHAEADTLQAENLRAAYRAFRNTDYVAQTYWFSIQDIGAAGLHYGLLDQRGNVKPSFRAFRAQASY